jgi:hypothetical protein
LTKLWADQIRYSVDDAINWRECGRKRSRYNPSTHVEGAKNTTKTSVRRAEIWIGDLTNTEWNSDTTVCGDFSSS